MIMWSLAGTRKVLLNHADASSIVTSGPQAPHA